MQTVEAVGSSIRESLIHTIEGLPDAAILKIQGYVERVSEEEKERRYDEYFNEHNMKRLRHSIEQLETGQVVTKTLAELEAMEND
jgi:precorrin-3B methylase